MSITESVTLEHVIEVLNRAVQEDPEAMKKLFATRVPCNNILAAAATIQVQRELEGPCTLSLLGLLNGIFGVDAQDWGAIAVLWGDKEDGSLLEFTDNGRR